MSDQRDGGISWTEETWNPIRGCSRISEGCRNCYAERQAGRMADGAYKNLVKLTPSGPRWTGKVALVEDKLAEPLRWTRPRMIFVNSMSDLFHEALTNEEIAAVFGVMAAAPRHTFQVLTKRAKRMREWFAWAEKFVIGTDGGTGPLAALWEALASTPAHLPSPLEVDDEGCALAKAIGDEWPLPNVWLGVSVEDQASADERIPHLLETPAAVRWVSYEPAIGPVDFGVWEPARAPWGALPPPASWDEVAWPAWVPVKVRSELAGFWAASYGRSPAQWLANANGDGSGRRGRVYPRFGERVRLSLTGEEHEGRYIHAWNNIGRVVKDDGTAGCVSSCDYTSKPDLDWIVVGGESGPGARPFDLAWARSTIAAGRAAGVPIFVKQLGSSVLMGPKDRGDDDPAITREHVEHKGGRIELWTEDLRVREWPKAVSR